jgi:hypothetical protein
MFHLVPSHPDMGDHTHCLPVMDGRSKDGQLCKGHVVLLSLFAHICHNATVSY